MHPTPTRSKAGASRTRSLERRIRTQSLSTIYGGMACVVHQLPPSVQWTIGSVPRYSISSDPTQRLIALVSKLVGCPTQQLVDCNTRWNLGRMGWQLTTDSQGSERQVTNAIAAIAAGTTHRGLGSLPLEGNLSTIANCVVGISHCDTEIPTLHVAHLADHILGQRNTHCSCGQDRPSRRRICLLHTTHTAAHPIARSPPAGCVVTCSNSTILSGRSFCVFARLTTSQNGYY